MNHESNAMTGSVPEPQVIAPAGISATRRMYWSVRRELWENRSIYLAPFAVAAVFLFGFLVSTMTLANRMRAIFALDPAQQHEALEQPYSLAAVLIMGTAFVVGVVYSLEALHGERRDRSILFWKSLPVSDLTTVLSKASIPLVVLPLLTVAIVVATQFIMLLLSSAVLLGNGLSVATLWRQLSLFPTSLMLLYHVLTVHVLWHAPIYGWLLLVSGWARRAAFIWAALPVLAIGVVEKIAFNTSHVAAILAHRVTGPEAFPDTAVTASTDWLTEFAPGEFLGIPGLWIGLGVATVFLAAAVRLRRYRGPI